MMIRWTRLRTSTARCRINMVSPTHCNALQQTARHCKNTATYTTTRTVAHHNTLQHTGTHCNAHYNTPQHTTRHCKTFSNILYFDMNTLYQDDEPNTLLPRTNIHIYIYIYIYIYMYIYMYIRMYIYIYI